MNREQLDTLAANLRRIVAADLWAEPRLGEPLLPEAVDWAQKVILNAADELQRLPASGNGAFKPYTKAEKQAYGQIMRAKREREEKSTGDRPAGKPVKKSHLYRSR